MFCPSGCDIVRLALVACGFLALSTPASAATDIGPYPFKVGDQFVFAYASTDSASKDGGTPSVTKEAYTETATIAAPVRYAFPAGSNTTVAAYPFVTKTTKG